METLLNYRPDKYKAYKHTVKNVTGEEVKLEKKGGGVYTIEEKTGGGQRNKKEIKGILFI